LVSKQQNYPNSLGLSFVVSRNTDLQKDIVLRVSFRKYVNISKKSCLSNKLSCLVSEYEVEIEKAVAIYFNPLFVTARINNNLFIYLNQEINKTNIYDVDYIYLNNYLQSKLIETLKSVLGSDLVELKNKNSVTYYGLIADYELQFYSIAESITYGGTEYKNVAALYDDSLISFVMDKLKEDIVNYATYKKLITEIEIFNQLKNYVTDLKSVYKPRNASPVWESKSYDNIPLALPVFEGEGHVFRIKRITTD
jgi:hypothetical protein